MAAMWESFERWPDEYFPYIQTFEKRSAQTTFNLTRYIDSEQRWEDYAADFQLYRVYGYSIYVPKRAFPGRKPLMADLLRRNGYAGRIRMSGLWW